MFGVSVKDRGAVSMAGHAGKAFWFSKAAQEWVTSSFYYKEYPGWVSAINQAGPTKRFDNTAWDLLHDPSTYLFGDEMTRNGKPMLPFGRVFPHR